MIILLAAVGAFVLGGVVSLFAIVIDGVLLAWDKRDERRRCELPRAVVRR